MRVRVRRRCESASSTQRADAKHADEKLDADEEGYGASSAEGTLGLSVLRVGLVRMEEIPYVDGWLAARVEHVLLLVAKGRKPAGWASSTHCC